MNVSLLEQIECTKLMYSNEVAPKVRELQLQYPSMKSIEVPPLEVMTRKYTRVYPYNEEYASARWNPILILHSSGSTGKRNPIYNKIQS